MTRCPTNFLHPWCSQPSEECGHCSRCLVRCCLQSLRCGWQFTGHSSRCRAPLSSCWIAGSRGATEGGEEAVGTEGQAQECFPLCVLQGDRN